MTKSYKLNVDCANCAAKMERAIAKLKGVESARINFMAQKLTLEAEEGSLANIIAEAQKLVRKIESTAVIKA